MSRSRILVAMSGGVDSSVAALLLKQQGHDVVGAYMKNWINEDNVLGHCPWMQDIDDARASAEAIGIEFRVVNLMQDYRRLVVDYLLDGYQRGLTPNPDVMCNREMKFGVFLNYAKAEGFSAIATGHYARRVPASSAGSGGGGGAPPPGAGGGGAPPPPPPRGAPPPPTPHHDFPFSKARTQTRTSPTSSRSSHRSSCAMPSSPSATSPSPSCASSPSMPASPTPARRTARASVSSAR